MTLAFGDGRRQGWSGLAHRRTSTFASQRAIERLGARMDVRPAPPRRWCRDGTIRDTVM
jgi:hypothetical protein